MLCMWEWVGVGDVGYGEGFIEYVGERCVIRKAEHDLS